MKESRLEEELKRPDNLEHEIIKFTDFIQSAELESQIFKPDSIKDFRILIIDSNRSICLTLTKYLHKLGFDVIKYSFNEKQGIFNLKNLTKENSKIIVFLDLYLPDSDPIETITSLFEIQPNIRIIIVSARERNDPTVISAFGNGAFRFLSKPISYSELKQVVNDIHDDELLLEENSEELNEKIENIIQNFNQITLAKLGDILDKPLKEIVPYLDKLETQKKVIKLEDKKEIACSNCLSVSLSETLQCPSCKKENFSQGKLIEHYSCGNISLDETYKDDFCPSCREKIKIVGVDHKIIPNFFVCNECQKKTPQLFSLFQCEKCGNKFSKDDIKWEKTPSYKIIRKEKS